MTLYNLLAKCKTIVLKHDDVKYSEIGHEFDISRQNQQYKAVWFETPVGISYLRSSTKQFTLAVNVMELCKNYDNLDDVLRFTSECEDVGDDVLHAMVDDLKAEGVMIDYNTVGAVTLRHFTGQDLVGVRYDLTFNVQSNAKCYKTRMETT